MKMVWKILEVMATLFGVSVGFSGLTVLWLWLRAARAVGDGVRDFDDGEWQ
ncbi:hypothetical protein [Acetobacter sp. DsW_063]|uniref:hypothetical protein n=1 Tax=Acetobacter sp. DsW_063 TaxID=1514894 RepID=UPI00130228E5|nr:hypothetical protein [Acetobacter sp. DsW_063]